MFFVVVSGFEATFRIYGCKSKSRVINEKFSFLQKRKKNIVFFLKYKEKVRGKLYKKSLFH